jgi:hypothetical protein
LGNGFNGWRTVTEKFVAFAAEESAGDGDDVIAAFENQPARDQAGAPLVFLGAALAAVRGDVFLGDAIDDGADAGPYAGSSAHGAGFVGGIENKVGEIASIAAADVFEGFQLHVFDAGAGGLHPVAGAGDDDFALAHEAGDDGADGIVAAIPGALGFVDGQPHELFLRLEGGRDHGRDYSRKQRRARISSARPRPRSGPWPATSEEGRERIERREERGERRVLLLERENNPFRLRRAEGGEHAGSC